MRDTVGHLDYVLCRNKGGAGLMASAYGKVAGLKDIRFVTRGPGVTNVSIIDWVGTGIKGSEKFQEIGYRTVFGKMERISRHYQVHSAQSLER
ncbi:hypothetical protein JQK88_33340 [Mesorhizobium caraganae]|uniref:thiamine pyrophosphate-binding protein n=1 Tax=Mesorhizobium caraganae TaxID=483206 RepID=UPI0019395C38|nr:thiamine pyrophosphate-binding protein [Mesorhizobium caraganae]MBM2715990.1 hypothetical protein [Mesorhizobium caraganae]